MKKRLSFAIGVGLPLVIGAQGGQRHAYVPRNGFVPDSLTAVRIAVAVWSPIYGEGQIMSEQPYRAELRGEVWTVFGSVPPGAVGGGAIAEISKRDARILRVSHGK